MYELYHPEKDKLGYPLNYDSELFTKRVKELANDIYESMLLIEKQTVSLPEDDIDKVIPIITKPKVFIAKVSDTLITKKNQIVKELEANNIEVVQKAFPPPYDKSKHEKAVAEALHKACLSIHLFDQMPGDKIEEDIYTFSQAQTNIARQLSKDQLIFIPKELDFNDIPSVDHKKFLQQLQNNKTDNDKYSLISEFALPNIIHEIKEKIKEKIKESSKKSTRQTNDQPSHSVFLDFHEQDNAYAIDMANLLFDNNIKTYFSRYKSNPTENINDYETQLKNVSSLIIICGRNIQEWARERLNKAIQTIMKEDCQVSECAVYLTPQVQNNSPLIRKSFLQIQYLDDSKSTRFNPDTVVPFIRKIA